MQVHARGLSALLCTVCVPSCVHSVFAKLSYVLVCARQLAGCLCQVLYRLSCKDLHRKLVRCFLCGIQFSLCKGVSASPSAGSGGRPGYSQGLIAWMCTRFAWQAVCMVSYEALHSLYVCHTCAGCEGYWCGCHTVHGC